MNQNQKTALIVSVISVVVLIILFVGFGSLWGWRSGGFGMMGPGMMGGFGTMFFLPVLLIVVLGLIVWAMIAALHKPETSDISAHKANSPIEILKKRYAQGEIDKEEYEAKKKDLI